MTHPLGRQEWGTSLRTLMASERSDGAVGANPLMLRGEGPEEEGLPGWGPEWEPGGSR